jgi:serine protease Do
MSFKNPSKQTLLNAMIAAFFVGTFFSPVIYSGFKKASADYMKSSAGPLSRESQGGLINLQEGYMNVYRKASPSVVYIRTNMLVKPEFWFDYYQQVQGAGSGFIVDNEGYIVTNDHVVANAQNIEVIFHDDTRAQAVLVGRDASSDIAVIKVPKSERLSPASIGDSDLAEPGMIVFALGAPFGLDRTFTSGIISAKQRTVDNTRFSRIQTDAAINPGNSGGPLLNIGGEVVGINQSIVNAGGTEGSVGIGFAIPINEAMSVIEQLKKEKRIIGKPAIGVSVGIPNPAYRDYLGIGDEDGVVVRFIIPGSAAEKAGLLENDFILTVNDKKMKSPEDLIKEVQKTGVGNPLKLEIIRAKKKMSINITVGEDIQNPRTGR